MLETLCPMCSKKDETSGIGVGVVIRDCNGRVMASYLPHIAEAMAILRGLQFTLETVLVPASLGSDALSQW
ncbi:hypothetical protein Ddye_016909 [Dipteronia dyeriana]|uniref:RNase H type-1 domain-containing protein n=1 Tax=Dipteronia dyeriana TaxID=168575 RepID=A0AAD9U8K2_9ROSI|nr:hypothetical protein Ddye_016909 [Dipteronia dyeriana]